MLCELIEVVFGIMEVMIIEDSTEYFNIYSSRISSPRVLGISGEAL